MARAGNAAAPRRAGFHAFGPPGDSVLTFYSQVEPITVGGRMALAGALRDAGRTEEATAIARALWRGTVA